MHVFYLHGFASSASSTKAGYLASKLRERGTTLHTPDFNEPEFSTLTITRMIDQLTTAIDALPAGPVALVGSSLGGFVAVQTALKYQGANSIDRLVLLAPALEFGDPSTGSEPSQTADGSKPMRGFGDRSLDDWKATGRLNVFHYAYGRLMPVHFALYSDACLYDCVGATLTMPIQIFQGKNDTAVDPMTVQRWARARPNVELHLLDDDHQLGASLDYIWGESRRFLGL